MELVTQVAAFHRGVIDWEPYMVTMFSRFLHWMNLPVNYEKGDKYSPYRAVCMRGPAAWIVCVLVNTIYFYVQIFRRPLQKHFLSLHKISKVYLNEFEKLVFAI